MCKININLEISFEPGSPARNVATIQCLQEELSRSIRRIQECGIPETDGPPSFPRAETPDFFQFARHETEALEKDHRHNTARNYRTALACLREHHPAETLPFGQVTPQFISSFEEFLKQKGCCPNTVSCYMRTLRAVYNKAVGRRLAEQTFPFGQVFTGMASTRKRAVSSSLIGRLLHLDCSRDPSMQFAKDLFLFSFYTRGMAFVDIARLKHSHIAGGYLKYQRSKTSQPVMVRIEPPAREIIRRYRHLSPSGYLFPLLKGGSPDDCYKEYRYQLGLYNKRLARLSLRLGPDARLSSYVSRHSWATLAHGQGIPLPVISESLGHASERTTRVYVKSLEKEKLDHANLKLINEVIRAGRKQ